MYVVLDGVQFVKCAQQGCLRQYGAETYYISANETGQMVDMSVDVFGITLGLVAAFSMFQGCMFGPQVKVLNLS